MDASPSPTRPAAAQRARGTARVTMGPDARLRDLYQQGCLKVVFPGRGAEAVLVNTAGGLTGGDRVEVTAEAAPGARLTLSTQAAERGYRASAETPAFATVRLSAGAGARLHWLPQETILYDGARLRRRIEADLAPDATFLAVEAVIFGRTAMGERFRSGLFADDWRIRRGGRLVWADAMRLGPDPGAQLDHPWTTGGAGAVVTLFCAGPSTEAAVAALRTHLPAPWGVSLLDPDAAVARGVAEDGHALRARLVPALEAVLRGPLPKVWRL